MKSSTYPSPLSARKLYRFSIALMNGDLVLENIPYKYN
jgi:hypothetical protein